MLTIIALGSVCLAVTFFNVPFEKLDWYFLVLEYVNGSDVRALIQRAGQVEQLLFLQGY